MEVISKPLSYYTIDKRDKNLNNRPDDKVISIKHTVSDFPMLSTDTHTGPCPPHLYLTLFL